MVSETFRNIPKVSKSFGDGSLDYINFTYYNLSSNVIKVIFVRNMVFLAQNPM